MTRNEWLDQLANGDPVTLRTKRREYPATVRGLEGDKLWVDYTICKGLESATWVARDTGQNKKTGYSVNPWQETATVEALEGANEALQGAQRDNPLPCYSQEDSAPQIASFLARDGMAGGWEAA